MTSATVRVEFSLTHVGLFRSVRLRRGLSSGSSGRLRPWRGLSKNKRRTYDRCQEGRLDEYALLHFDLPFQAGKRNRYVTVVSQMFVLPVLANCRE
jgi:hypothetical protein